MSCNPRRFRQPVRLIVSVEAHTVNAIDAYMHAGGPLRQYNACGKRTFEMERKSVL
jgi:hypothetical protein